MKSIVNLVVFILLTQFTAINIYGQDELPIPKGFKIECQAVDGVKLHHVKVDTVL